MPAPLQEAAHQAKPMASPGRLTRRLAFERVSSSAPPKWETRLNKHLDAETMVSLVESMLALPNNILVQRQGCYALWKISLDGTVGRQAALACGGAAAASNAMRANLRDLEVARHGCAALWNLALDESGALAVCVSGGGLSIVAALRAYPQDLELLRLGIGALSNMCFGSPACKQAVVDADGIRAVVDIMLAWPPTARKRICIPPSHNSDHMGESIDTESLSAKPMLAWSIKEIHRSGCAALRNLAMGEAPFKDHVCDSGGVRAIITAATAFRDFPDVQLNACGALQHLAATGAHGRGNEDGHQGRNPGLSRKTALIEQGGLTTTLAAMQQCPSNADLQRCACSLLCSLAWGDAVCKKAVLKDGGVRACTAAMTSLYKDREVQLSGCCMLKLIAKGGEAAINSVIESEGPSAIVTAMLNFCEDLTIQRNGCAALCNLTASGSGDNPPDAGEAVASSGGASAIVLALSTHEKDAVVQQMGCAAALLGSSGPLRRSTPKALL